MPEPAYSFTVPSVEDDTTLDCRLYHPKTLLDVLGSNTDHVKGAVLAHPYAPLGGCYDDPVIKSVTNTLLEQGYVVATFNFRGAGDSQGRMSWTGRPETEDFMSVAGLMIYYVHSLDLAREGDGLISVLPPDNQGSGISRHPGNDRPKAPLLILGGYSYGSLVLARLPPPHTIIDHFQKAPSGTAAAEIIMRARTLAKQSLQVRREQQSLVGPRGRTSRLEGPATSPSSARSQASTVTMGGEETHPSERRHSRTASRRSADFVPRSIEKSQHIKQHIRHASDGPKPPATVEEQRPQTPAKDDSRGDSGGESTPAVRVGYLLISPVLLPWTNILLPPGPPMPSFYRQRRVADESPGAPPFARYPTLAVFGTKDTFTSSRRLQAWARKAEKESVSSNFVWKLVEDAGHFWREDSAMRTLKEQIASWVLEQPSAV